VSKCLGARRLIGAGVTSRCWHRTNRSEGATRRPRGPQTPCGRGWCAKLTGQQMRAHFAICLKRPAASEGHGQTALVTRQAKGSRERYPDQARASADAPRLGLQRRTHGERNADALHRLPEAAGHVTSVDQSVLRVCGGQST